VKIPSHITRGTPVRITWEDAACDENDGWVHPDDVDEHMVRVVSVGHFVKSTRKLVVLSGDWREDESVIHMTSRIPTGCVVKVEVLS
jgi:hypothetical protein